MIYLLKDKARLAQDREMQEECSDIINRDHKRERYLRDLLPWRLAGLTADLAGSEAIQPQHLAEALQYRPRISIGL